MRKNLPAIYVYNKKVIFVTDHKPLVWFKTADCNTRVQKWRFKLSEFDYEVLYKPGKLNANADALSRNPVCNIVTRAQAKQNIHTNTNLINTKNIKEPKKKKVKIKENKIIEKPIEEEIKTTINKDINKPVDKNINGYTTIPNYKENTNSEEDFPARINLPPSAKTKSLDFSNKTIINEDQMSKVTSQSSIETEKS